MGFSLFIFGFADRIHNFFYMQYEINILCEFGDVFEVVTEYFCSIFVGNLYCIIISICIIRQAL